MAWAYPLQSNNLAGALASRGGSLGLGGSGRSLSVGLQVGVRVPEPGARKRLKEVRDQADICAEPAGLQSD